MLGSLLHTIPLRRVSRSEPRRRGIISTTITTITLLLSFCTTPTQANCTGPYKGKTFTDTTLKPLIAKHQQWLSSGRKSKPGPLNLCGTHLKRVNLSKLDLSYINLSGADLSDANLSGANLSHANCQKSFFRWTKMQLTNFSNADLTQAVLDNVDAAGGDFRQAIMTEVSAQHAQINSATLRGISAHKANFNDADMLQTDLSWADLSQANLSDGDLSESSFSDANLSQTNFDNTILSKVNFNNANLSQAIFTPLKLDDAKFDNTNLQDTIFQPLLGTLPDLISLAHSQHFNTVRLADYRGGIATFNALRNAYKENSMRSMERTITAIIKQEEMHRAWQHGGWGYLESMLSYAVFQLTSDYGASPGRPLQILLVLVLFLILPYHYALQHPNRKAGIMVIWRPKRYFHWDKANVHPRELMMSKMLHAKHPSGFTTKLVEQWRLLRISFLFSLLSAVSIGWRELNVSHFLLRLQSREYTLKGRGWVRVVAGAQALICAYLIVLWALTYFGRPFEW